MLLFLWSSGVINFFFLLSNRTDEFGNVYDKYGEPILTDDYAEEEEDEEGDYEDEYEDEEEGDEDEEEGEGEGDDEGEDDDDDDDEVDDDEAELLHKIITYEKWDQDTRKNLLKHCRDFFNFL